MIPLPLTFRLSISQLSFARRELALIHRTTNSFHFREPFKSVWWKLHCMWYYPTITKYKSPCPKRKVLNVSFGTIMSWIRCPHSIQELRKPQRLIEHLPPQRRQDRSRRRRQSPSLAGFSKTRFSASASLRLRERPTNSCAAMNSLLRLQQLRETVTLLNENLHIFVIPHSTRIGLWGWRLMKTQESLAKRPKSHNFHHRSCEKVTNLVNLAELTTLCRMIKISITNRKIGFRSLDNASISLGSKGNWFICLKLHKCVLRLHFYLLQLKWPK